LQEKFATDPTSSPLTVTAPFVGSLREGHMKMESAAEWEDKYLRVTKLQKDR
jgi:hypothetical protein